jgi:hypothetical protein
VPTGIGISPPAAAVLVRGTATTSDSAWLAEVAQHCIQHQAEAETRSNAESPEGKSIGIPIFPSEFLLFRLFLPFLSEIFAIPVKKMAEIWLLRPIC